jgi:hypothetical protein
MVSRLRKQILIHKGYSFEQTTDLYTKGTLNALDNPDEDAYQNITVFKELGQ